MKHIKKLLLCAMIAALLAVPFQGVALAENQAAPQTGFAEREGFVPGAVPAETGAVQAMTPAIHAVILAMLHYDMASFDPSHPQFSWEALYNMLSLYGQLDERSDYLGERLVLPVETVMDFSAALFPSFSALGTLPGALADRMVYDPEIDSYLLTCGSDSLAEIRLTAETWNARGELELSGALVYLVDGTDLARFQATLSPRDSMFGYTLSALVLDA